MKAADLLAILSFTKDNPNILPHVLVIYKLGFMRGIIHEQLAKENYAK